MCGACLASALASMLRATPSRSNIVGAGASFYWVDDQELEASSEWNLDPALQVSDARHHTPRQGQGGGCCHLSPPGWRQSFLLLCPSEYAHLASFLANLPGSGFPLKTLRCQPCSRFWPSPAWPVHLAGVLPTSFSLFCLPMLYQATVEPQSERGFVRQRAVSSFVGLPASRAFRPRSARS